MKKAILKAMSIVMALILCTATFSAAFAAEGVPDGYTAVYSAEDLNNIRNNLSGKYILMNDIDLSSYENWEPIGTSENPFCGELDGNGYSIKNLKTKADFTSLLKNFIGLFGFVKKSKLTEINLSNISIDVNFPYSSTYYIGGITGGCTDSIIDSCKVSGNIYAVTGGSVNIGGIVGYVNDESKSTKITKCTSKANIDFVGENNDLFNFEGGQYTYVGGIAGSVYFANIIYRCNVDGNISVKSINEGSLGKIVGINKETKIMSCKSAGEITANGSCSTNEIVDDSTLQEKIKAFFNDFFEYIKKLFGI